MKKIICLLLVLVMCTALFAGCGGNTTTTGTPDPSTTAPAADDNALTKAKEYVFSMYKDKRDTETAIDYTRVSAVMIGDKTYPITWSFEITSGDGSCLSVETGASLTTIKVEKNYSGAVVEYNLVATISDGNGKTESVKFAHSVPMSKKVASLEDGTYVISTDGLSMAAMAEDKTYGYPTANEVTDTSFTAADIVTITNVIGGVTIQDSHGRYYYLKGTYNSFNLATEMPEEGHIFELQVNDDGTVSLVNVLMQKTLAYSTGYSSWGCYSTLGDGYLSSLKIVNADASVAHTHTEEVIPGKAATCTEDGLTEGKKCTECGAILVEQETIAAAHTWGEWEVTKEATVTAEGEKVRTCTVCGEKETKVIDKVTEGTTEKKVILINQGSYVTATNSPYTSSSGTVKNQLAMSADKAEAMVLTVRENSDGTVTFVTADGKFLLADGTHVQLVDTEGDNTLFVLEETDGGYFIKCANATYNNNAQYLEVYSGNLTCYGMNASNAAIYTFTVETIEEAAVEEKVVLVNQSKYITGEDYLYTSSSGSKKHELVISNDKTAAVELVVRKNEDGTVTFITADGKFLLADGTNVQLVDTEGDNTLFVLEETDGGYFIKCANATYNNNAQYLEVYNGYLTCYGMNASNAVIYTFTLEAIA